MPRLTKLDDVLFPVEEHPVFAIAQTKAGEQRLPVPDKKAIVNRTSGRVLGVVSRGYRLVSNREALNMAHDCCRAVFPETKPGEWDVRAADAPASGGHCFIDLVHKPKSAKPETREAADWESLETHIKEMCDRYAKDLGHTAYAVFNAVTEFASYPPENRCVYRERHSFQRRAGFWLTDFTRECIQPDFDLQKHIEKIAKNGSNGTAQPATIHGRQP